MPHFIYLLQRTVALATIEKELKEVNGFPNYSKNILLIATDVRLIQ